MVSLHFLDNDRLAKNNKVAGYQLLHPTPIVVVIVSFFSFHAKGELVFHNGKKAADTFPVYNSVWRR